MTKVNLFTKQNQITDIENRLEITKGKRGGEGRGKLGVWD